jgi:hypothetical protein
MKTLLAILLSFIISEAPVFALHGGYTLGGSQSVTGTYAGVLVPTSNDLLAADATNFGSDALGLFTLSIPSTGLGSGTVLIFSGADTFTGTIQAVANPNNDTGVEGVLTATYNYNLYVPVTTPGENGNPPTTTISTEAVTATAEGPFSASTVSNPNSAGGLGLDLDGTSQVSVDQGFVNGGNGAPIIIEKITFAVEGFQQSTTASATTTTTTGG